MQLHPKHQIITAEPDIEETTLQVGDEFLILACDGIWDVMTKYVIFICIEWQFLLSDAILDLFNPSQSMCSAVRKLLTL